MVFANINIAAFDLDDSKSRPLVIAGIDVKRRQAYLWAGRSCSVLTILSLSFKIRVSMVHIIALNR